MTSCMDTIVLPNDKTVGEDFWKSKEDVTGMVSGAYKAMCSEAVIERCIVWGDFRSDNLNSLVDPLNVAKENDLKDISSGNMTFDNTYADWSSFYTVINRCNIVLEKAQAVVSIDPSYTIETYYTDESQMLALRALCYFYLVRAYRDVPYTRKAYMNSSSIENLPQQSPLFVLDKCIEDLNMALEHPLSPMAFSDWRNVGLLNRDAIKAILADIHLWKASMLKSLFDYQMCVEYCQEIIDSKKQQYEINGSPSTNIPGGGNLGMVSGEQKQYPLADGIDAYNEIFIQGNSSESIFELQMDGTNNANNGLRNCYWNYDDRSRTTGLMKAPFALFGSSSETNSIYTQYDYRYWNNCFNVGATDLTDLSVRKMISGNILSGTATAPTADKAPYANDVRGTKGSYERFSQNWIFYRLTDIMLMKAEALVQIGDSISLTEAFDLAREVNKRSMTDTLQAITNTCATQEDYEKLVLAERQRELCFEGKRWFDLLRYNYRHVTGVQPDKMLWEIAGENGTELNFVPNYPEMMSLMQRKYLEAGSAIGSKMNREAHLYFPIIESEIKSNQELKQNPVYKADDMYVKN